MKSHLNNSSNQILQMRNIIEKLHQNEMKCKCKYPLYTEWLKSNKKYNYEAGIKTLKQLEKIYFSFHTKAMEKLIKIHQVE